MNTRVRPLIWTALGMANALCVGYDGGTRGPSLWWLFGVVIVLAWPWVVDIEYSENHS